MEFGRNNKMQDTYPVGQAPWETSSTGNTPDSFVVGQAPWETNPDASQSPMSQQPQLNVTGQNPSGSSDSGIVGKILDGIGSDYASAIPNFLKAAGSGQSQASDIGDYGKPIGEGNAAIRNVGEGALAATSSGLNTVFSPITRTVQELASHLSNNKTVQDFLASDQAKGSLFGKVLDLVGQTQNAISDFQTKNPELATNIGNALNVGSAAIGGEAEGGLNEGLSTAVSKTGDVIESGANAAIKPVADYISGGANKISDALQEQSLKLTPTQKATLGNKLTDVKNYLSDNNITGDPETRYKAIEEKYNESESTLQDFLTNKAKDVVVDKNQLIDQFNSIKNDYKLDRDSGAINKQIDEAISTVKSNFPDKIPVADLNTFKRSTYAGAYNKAGSKILDDVEHDIGDKSRQAIEDATDGMKINGKSLGNFNKEYGTIINAKRILNRARTKSELGFSGKWTSRLIGGLIGHAMGGGVIGEIGGGAIGESIAKSFTGTAAKTKIASLLKKKID